MKVEVKVIREAENDRDRQALNIEQHNRRGDTFNVQTARQVMEGDTETFTLAPGAKLIVSTPHADERPVYDRESGAAIYMSRQTQDVGADQPVGAARSGGHTPTRAELDAELAKLPGTYHDPDYVVNQMRGHWGSVFTADDERVVRAKVTPRTPPQGGRVGGSAQGVHSVAPTPTGSAPAAGSGVSTPSGPGVSAPVRSNESPNSPARANATSSNAGSTASSPGDKSSGGNTEKK